MSELIKFPKGFSGVITGIGNKVLTNSNEYFHFPFWLKKTDDKDTFELFSYEKIPEDLKQAISNIRAEEKRKNDTIFRSSHELDFLDSPHEPQILDPGEIPWRRFKIGTCHGLWRANLGNYEILAIKNEEPGNGHFEDVLEWFKNSCIRDSLGLVFVELENKKFKKHLITKRGFSDLKDDNNSVGRKF